MENFNDFLFPFSLGCLDKEDRKNLKEYIENGGDFNFQELGEYQNLVSLLPCILNIETPDPLLKDDVARKLYKLKDEIKAQRNKNKSIPRVQELTKETTPEKPRFEISKEFEDFPLFESINEDDVVKKPEKTIDRGKDMSQLYKTYNPEDEVDNEDKVLSNENQEHLLPEDNYTHEDNSDFEIEQQTKKPFYEITNQKPLHVEEDNIENVIRDANPPMSKSDFDKPKVNYGMMLIVFLLFFLVVIGLLIGYWKISTDVKEYKNDVEKLNKQISSLTMRLSSSQEIDQMLQSPNVQIINLKGTNLNSSGYGKLIISPENGKGYIQLAQMPTLPDDKTFQLWISVSGNFMPLETFHASEKMEYYSFKMPSLPHGYDVSFLITEEPTGGSKTPGKKVYLTGNM